MQDTFVLAVVQGQRPPMRKEFLNGVESAVTGTTVQQGQHMKYPALLEHTCRYFSTLRLFL